MDFREIIEDRLVGMHSLLESSDIYSEFTGVNEGLIGRIKEIKADKKAIKAEKEAREAEERKFANEVRKEKNKNNAMKNSVRVSDISEAENEFNKLISDIQNILTSEIPNVRLEKAKLSHNRTELNDGLILHKEAAVLFNMSDDNLKKFIDSSNNKTIKALKATNDAVKVGKDVNRVKKAADGEYYNTADSVLNKLDKLSADKLKKLIDDEFKARIIDKIEGLGGNYKRGMIVIQKDGLDYMSIKIEDLYFNYNIKVSIKFIVDDGEKE